nr:MAG TPA: hypothetical protein [Crassvirales sp.]
MFIVSILTFLIVFILFHLKLGTVIPPSYFILN